MKSGVIFSVTAFISILVLGSCSKFKRLQKSDDWRVKYEGAIKYYEKGDYYKSSILFEDILPIIRGTDEAEKGNFLYAYSFYYQKQYLLAAHRFEVFYKTYARSEYATEAMYMQAYSLHLESPTYSLDQESTYEAISSMQRFLNKYPYSKHSKEANRIIDKLQVKLEKKSYENTKLYYKLSRLTAAVIAIENFQDNFPDSDYNEELIYLKIKAQYTVAKQSIQSKQKDRLEKTIEYYESYVDDFPNSKYLESAEKIYSICIEELKKG